MMVRGPDVRVPDVRVEAVEVLDVLALVLLRKIEGEGLGLTRDDDFEEMTGCIDRGCPREE
jgi:hypothetical protein